MTLQIGEVGAHLFYFAKEKISFCSLHTHFLISKELLNRGCYRIKGIIFLVAAAHLLVYCFRFSKLGSA